MSERWFRVISYVCIVLCVGGFVAAYYSWFVGNQDQMHWSLAVGMLSGVVYLLMRED